MASAKTKTTKKRSGTATTRRRKKTPVASGKPALFRVVPDGVHFGYLSFKNSSWCVNENRPDCLVLVAGKEIGNIIRFRCLQERSAVHTGIWAVDTPFLF